MTQITVRIDLGAAEVHLAGVVLKSEPITIEIPLDRIALAGLIAGAPVGAPASPAPVAADETPDVPSAAAPEAETPVPSVVEVVAQPEVVPRKRGPQRALARHSDDHLREKLSSMTGAQAAVFFGVTDQTIYAERRRLGINKDDRVRTKPATAIQERRSLTEIADVELRQILASGRPWDKIAADYGTTVHGLTKEAGRLGVPVPSSKRQEVIRSLADMTFPRAGSGADQRGPYEQAASHA